MSKEETYFVVECWEDVPDQDDRRIHTRYHYGSEASLRMIWNNWNSMHPDRRRYDRIISRHKTKEDATLGMRKHLASTSKK